MLNQLASIQAALNGVSKSVVRNYFERCASEAIRSSDTKVYDEMVETIYKFMK